MLIGSGFFGLKFPSRPQGEGMTTTPMQPPTRIAAPAQGEQPASASAAVPVARLFVRPLAGLCAGAAVFGVAFIAFALWGSFLRPDESDAILGQLRGGFSRAGIFRSKVTAQ